jgi:CcmD family protein
VTSIRTILLVLVTHATTAAALGAQVGGNLGAQSLRPYWHVFIAYAIAWALIGGWVISIARRLGALEKRPRE